VAAPKLQHAFKTQLEMVQKRCAVTSASRYFVRGSYMSEQFKSYATHQQALAQTQVTQAQCGFQHFGCHLFVATSSMELSEQLLWP
jgi:hypothetical protein